MKHQPQCNKPKKITFKYKITDSKMESAPLTDGLLWSGWAPAFDAHTNERIGYITFYYLQQQKYNNQNIADGYNNYLKIFYVLDIFQSSSSVQTHVLTSEMNFASTLPNQRLPVGLHKSKLSSSTIDINDKSYVKVDISAASSQEKYIKVY